VAGPKKVDWKPIKDAYVTEGKSARELARQYSLSNSTISARARAEDWDGQQLAYKNAVARRSYERIADSVAHEQTEITKESVLAARMYVRKFISDLNDGSIKPNAKDAIAFISLLVSELRQETTVQSDTGPTVLTVEQAPDADTLRRILEVARSHVADPGSMGTGLLVDPPTARPN
jgi:hypothetical protein